jgi:hypothetical protein
MEDNIVDDSIIPAAQESKRMKRTPWNDSGAKDAAIYLDVDIEVKGENMIKHDLLCFAACLGDSSTGEILDTFEVYVKPLSGSNETGWEELCLLELWDRHEELRKKKALILDRITNQGVTSKEAMIALRKWANNRPLAIRERITVVADTNGFDIGVLNYHLALAGMPDMYHLIDGDEKEDHPRYRPIYDTTSFNRGVGFKMPEDGDWGAEDAACKQLGRARLENPFKADHMPLNDCQSNCFDMMMIHHFIYEKKNGNHLFNSE